MIEYCIISFGIYSGVASISAVVGPKQCLYCNKSHHARVLPSSRAPTRYTFEGCGIASGIGPLGPTLINGG